MLIQVRAIFQFVISGWFRFNKKQFDLMRSIFRSVTLLFPGFMALACYGQAPAGAFSVRKYGAKGDGHTPDTRAFAKAVAACVKAGGGTVYVPAGKYVTGTIRL